MVGGQWSVVYVGSVDGMEAGLVAQESDLSFRAVPVAALRGRSPLALARNLGTLARGTQAARRLIAAERPAAILGTGGYVCVPLFLAARAARVPTALYLPDVVPGMAVRFLARLSTTVAWNVEDSARYFRRPTDGRPPSVGQQPPPFVVTGYPVRRELFEQDRALPRGVRPERAAAGAVYLRRQPGRAEHQSGGCGAAAAPAADRAADSRLRARGR